MSAAVKASADRFASETAKHTMKVLHDDGLYQHLLFRSPDNSFYWFEIVTWPGKLSIGGDVDGFTFSRTEDMIGFFRQSSHEGGINAGYWAEKVVASRKDVKAYSEDLFNALVAADLKEAETDYPGVTKAWAEATAGYCAEYNTEYEHYARQALEEFSFGSYRLTCSCGEVALFSSRYGDADAWRSDHGGPGVHRVDVEEAKPFTFYDTSDWDLTDYSWAYLWCCNAIVWGIGQYDAAKKAGAL